MAVRTGSRENRSGSTLVEPFRGAEQFLDPWGARRRALLRIEDPAVEGAEGETGQRIRFDTDRDEDGAVLLDPAVGPLDLALQPHRGHLLLRLGAAAQKQIDIAAGDLAHHR